MPPIRAPDVGVPVPPMPLRCIVVVVALVELAAPGVAIDPDMPAPIAPDGGPARLMLSLGELIGGVTGLIVTPVEPMPDVPVLTPLVEGAPSRMVL